MHDLRTIQEPAEVVAAGLESPAVRLSEIIAALSFALDLTEGQGMGHSIRACAIGMRLADVVGIDATQRSALFYAILLKDAGCSSNAARLAALFGADDRTLKHDHKLIDWSRGVPSAAYAIRHAAPGDNPWKRFTRVLAIGANAEMIGRDMIAVRCERGAAIAAKVGVPAAAAQAIRQLDEHWDGGGHPDGLRGTAISPLARIMGLAQTFEVFFSERGVDAAYAMARQRSGAWFEPALVRGLEAFEGDMAFWSSLGREDALGLADAYEPADGIVEADEARLDDIAEAFAWIIDAKSPYTYHHSEGVARIAVQVAGRLGFGAWELRELRRTALLHDIGKLAVSNAILDKPGRLTDEEMAVMRTHPRITFEILSRVARFQSLADVAAAHHERLDGTGYHRGLVGAMLSPAARVLAVADVCEALTAARPYRAAMPWDEVTAMLVKMAGTALCPVSVDALVAGGAGA